MGKDSNIQWCDSTVNASSGCAGCELAKPSLDEDDRRCWAYWLQQSRLSLALPELYSSNFFEVRQIPGRIRKAASWKDLRGAVRKDKPWLPSVYPRLIFLSDMADLLSPQIPFEYIRDEVLAGTRSPQGSRHIWLMLTKQAKRLVDFAEWLRIQNIAWPQNVWPGVSLTRADTAWRIDYLMRVPARHHFVSYEPGWEWIPIFDQQRVPSWIIVGGESGPNAKPFDATIAERLIAGGRIHKSSIFVKQLGRKTLGIGSGTHTWADSHGGDWDEWPERFRVREFPPLNYPTREDDFCTPDSN